jgi:hypothetical protein
MSWWAGTGKRWLGQRQGPMHTADDWDPEEKNLMDLGEKGNPSFGGWEKVARLWLLYRAKTKNRVATSDFW